MFVIGFDLRGGRAWIGTILIFRMGFSGKETDTFGCAELRRSVGRSIYGHCYFFSLILWDGLFWLKGGWSFFEGGRRACWLVLRCTVQSGGLVGFSLLLFLLLMLIETCRIVWDVMFLWHMMDSVGCADFYYTIWIEEDSSISILRNFKFSISNL